MPAPGFAVAGRGGSPALSRRSFLAGTAATAGGVLLGGPTLWLQPARAGAPAARGVHLGFGGDATRTMNVAWSTARAVSGAVVDIGVDDAFGLTLPAESRPAPGVSSVYHHVRVTGLDPGVEYHYRIRQDGSAPTVGRFRTAPHTPAAFRFATFGDMGLSDGAQQNLQRIMAARPDFCFVVGDLCYADLSGGSPLLALLPNDPTVWDQWLTQIAPSASSVPWMTTVGNHEMERGGGELGYDGYLARFSPPRNGVRGGPVTYTFRYGNTAFVALDGNDASFEIDRNREYLGVAQDRWLDSTLAAHRADRSIDFIVVGFHNCMYCSNAFHGSDGGNRGRWRRILERHSVDLVVNGHNHCYERTHPLRAATPVSVAGRGGSADSSLGTTYLTAGGAGQAEYPTIIYPAAYVVVERGLRVPELAKWSAVRYPGHSIAIVDVTPPNGAGVATMTITGVAKDGSRVDRVTLRRRRVGAAAATA